MLCQNLEALKLEHNDLKGEQVQQILASLLYSPALKTLTELRLRGNCICDKAAETIANVADQATKLQIFDISNQ